MAMDSERRIGELIGLIYDAAVAPERWALFLDRLCDLAPNAKGILMLHDARTKSAPMVVTARWEEDLMDDYSSHFVTVNDWAENYPKIKVGRAYVGEEVVSRDALIKGEFYNDWLKAQHLITGSGLIITHEDDRFMILSILHSDMPDDSCDRNVNLLQTLQPHLQRATQINRQIAGLNAKTQAMENAFDHLDSGVVLLDGEGKAFYFNARAKAYLARGDGLSLSRGGQILCARQDIQQKLHRAIFDASKTANGFGISAGEIIAVPRAHGGMPWSVMVAPMPASAMDFGRPEGAVALFIIDPDQKPVLSVIALRTILGLTVAEARVAIALADGNAPEEIAQKLGITTLTVRTHLRNAMGKTETRRLAELVALVLRCGGAP
jgi:DNA-binding CsgD family transcriptional regulator/PAS domain-containing protein